MLALPRPFLCSRRRHDDEGSGAANPYAVEEVFGFLERSALMSVVGVRRSNFADDVMERVATCGRSTAAVSGCSMTGRKGIG